MVDTYKNAFKEIGRSASKEDYIKEKRENLRVIEFNIKNEVNPNSLQGELNMKGITLRKDGRYIIRRTINHKTFTKYARTLKEAQKIYTKLKRLNEKGEEKKVYTFNY